jgi:exonuclease III
MKERPLKLVAWNIQHGGGTRLPPIVEEISAYDPDVVAVTEFRARPGMAPRAAMKEGGLPHVETTNPAGRQKGVAVFSRRATTTRSVPTSGFVQTRCVP